MIIPFIVAAASVAISYSAHRRAKKAAKAAEDAAKGVLANKNSNIEALPVIYGQRRVGGTRVFVSTKSMPDGNENKYLYIALALCEGEIGNISDIRLDNTPITDDRFNGLVSYNTHLGADVQNADSLLLEAPGWGATHKLNGIAYIAMRLTYDQEAFNGIPDITCLVQGRKLRRFASSYTDSNVHSPVYSNNPVAILYDYLVNERFGKGLSYTKIDINSFDDVNSRMGSTGNVINSPFDVNVYQCNYVLQTNNKIIDNVADILSSFNGYLTYTNGKYRLEHDRNKSPIFGFTDEDILGNISLNSGSKAEHANKVTVKFSNEAIDYQPDQESFPAPGTQVSNDFLDDDYDEKLETVIDLPACTNPHIAADLARLYTYKSRNNIVINFTVHAGAVNSSIATDSTSQGTAINVMTGDVIAIVNSKFGWDEKEFQVEEVTLNSDMTVNIQAKEYDSSIYTWQSTTVKTYPDTNLPDPFTVNSPTNLEFTDSSIVADDGSLVPTMTITWEAPADSTVSSYEVRYKKTTQINDYGDLTTVNVEADYGLITNSPTQSLNYGVLSDPIGQTDEYYNTVKVYDTQFVITGVTPNVMYTIEVRAVNDFGVKSAWTTRNELVEGDTTPPSVPSNLTAEPGLRAITLTWERPLEADYSYMEVWESDYSNLLNAIKIAQAPGTQYIRSGLGYDTTKYYWIKAVDYSGNVSAASNVAFTTTLFVDSDAFSDDVTALFQEAGAYGIEPVATLPATGGFVGEIKYDTTDNALYRWTGSEWSDDIFSITEASVTAASFAADIEPVKIVSTLPNPVNYTGPTMVFLTTDNKLYRYDSTVPEFTKAIPAVDLVGEVPEFSFSQDLMPPKVVATLPTDPNELWQGRQVFLTTDNKLYRYDGNNWTAAVAAADLTGLISELQIADDAVTNAKLAVDAVQGDVIAASAISGDKIASDAIDSTKIADAAVDTAQLAVSAVTANIIASDAVTNVKIQDGAVLADTIGANAVTADKINANAVTADKINASAVTTDKIAANAITSAKVSAGSIDAGKIAASAITSGKIASNAITSAKINANAITAAKINANAVTADKINANAVTANKISAGAVSADKIGASAITADKISAGAVTAAKLGAQAVEADKIKAGAITSNKIAANAITSGKISANAITSGKIAANAITSNELAANAVTAGILAAGAITSDAIDANIITGDHIASNTIQTGNIAANQITGGLLATSGVITSAAQINNLVVSGAKIANGAISTAKIGNAAITTAKIADLQVDTIKIKDNAVTVTVSSTNMSGGKDVKGAVQRAYYTLNGTQYNSFTKNGTRVTSTIGEFTINVSTANTPIFIDFYSKFCIGTDLYYRNNQVERRQGNLLVELLRGNTVIYKALEFDNNGFVNSISNTDQNNPYNFLSQRKNGLALTFLDNSAPAGNNTYKVRISRLQSHRPDRDPNTYETVFSHVMFRGLEVLK